MQFILNAVGGDRSPNDSKEGRETYQEDVVILRLGAQELEDRLLPELLHVGEVLNQTVADGPGSRIRLLVLHSLISNEAVQILDTLADSTVRILLGGDHGREDVAGLGVTGITHLGVTLERKQRQRGSASVVCWCMSVSVCALCKPNVQVCELLAFLSSLLLGSPYQFLLYHRRMSIV